MALNSPSDDALLLQIERKAIKALRIPRNLLQSCHGKFDYSRLVLATKELLSGFVTYAISDPSTSSPRPSG